MRALIAVLAAVAFLAGCNTVQGLGKDVQKAGSAVENAAKSHSFECFCLNRFSRKNSGKT